MTTADASLEDSDPPLPAGNRLTSSVVICAYTEDRWDETADAVASALDQNPPPDELFLVIDHNPILLRRFQEKYAKTRVMVVPNQQEQGLSGARNTGIGASSGDVIVFLDDDASARTNWLVSLLRAYERPEVVAVGGQTLPAWRTARPPWWPTEFDWVIGCSYEGLSPGPVRNLLGGNASFRRTVFQATGGFSSEIGRTAITSLPLGCEETELCIRAAREMEGAVILYEPSAVVDHCVPASRARFRYFASRCYAEGISKALVTRNVGVNDGLSTERSYVMTALRLGVMRSIKLGIRGNHYSYSRAATIVAGLTCTAAGYAMGIVRAGRKGGQRSLSAPGDSLS